MSEPDNAAAEAARQTATARSRWLDPGWRAMALAWVEAELARLGRRVGGPVEQPHIRPWSTTMVVPTDAGRVWFKAGGPGTSYEATLLDRLARWGTHGILQPLAVDPDRGWLLLPDGGARLRETLDGGPGVDAWMRILRGYAGIQRELAARATELISAGVPDLRPATMASRLAALLESPEVGLSATDRRRLEALVPDYAGWCTELASMGIESSLQHDDLHDGNVFVGSTGDRIFDWGDASVAHPFGTLLVTFRSIVDRGLGGGRQEKRTLIRLRDAYLEPWTDRHARTELAEAVGLAMRVAITGRALSWQRSLAGVPASDHGEWGGNVGGWLLELFEPIPLG